MLILERRLGVSSPPQDESQRFDWLGAALSGGALLLFLLVIGSGHRLGWTSYLVIAGGISSVALAAAFVWRELRVASPMLELRLFKRKLVAMGVAAGWLSFFGTSATRFMVPFYLQRLLGLTPGEVGLVLIRCWHQNRLKIL